MSDLKEPTLRVGVVDGEAAVSLAAGELEATFLPGLGLLGTSLRHRRAGRRHHSPGPARRQLRRPLHRLGRGRLTRRELPS
ncbi:MAG TPA: hypothetical protein VJ931_10605 [Actinomycetota bacterium]|nr:hypothetical protein [Actinomycetota bacterium]